MTIKFAGQDAFVYLELWIMFSAEYLNSSLLKGTSTPIKESL